MLADTKNLENILDNLSDGVIVYDRQGRIVYFNRAAESATGHSRGEVLGSTCKEIFGALCRDEHCSLCEKALNSTKQADFSCNILTKQGEQRRIRMSVTSMTDETGCVVSVLAAFREVTDLVDIHIQPGKPTSFDGIVGRDHKMLQIFEQICELADNDFPVLISGETGTGKELVAAAFYQRSRRSSGPFVPVNCGALPQGVLESELFGHVKGAFSGAIRDKKGRFELADGGTIFLDEVAELPRSTQVNLLRVLQDGTFERVGAEKTTRVDVRVISATNRDLKREVEKKRFREDLYYRLNVVSVCVPPLRERKSDIPLLVEHFLEEVGKYAQKPSGLSKEAHSILMNYGWPGNVRELENAIYYASVKCRGGVIRAEHLPQELRNGKPRRGPDLKLTSNLVRGALDQTGGNKAMAARSLGVGRATLYRFLDSFPVSHETDVSHNQT
jgi:PAS domain S-box-containing protein